LRDASIVVARLKSLSRRAAKAGLLERLRRRRPHSRVVVPDKPAIPRETWLPSELIRVADRPADDEWRDQDSNLGRRSHLVYSQTPLTARESRRGL
jgi:hypothetical protein